MTSPSTSSRKLLVVAFVIIGVPAVLFACFMGMFIFMIFPRSVMTKSSPDGQHRAKLSRTNGVDFIFLVAVDGTCVYQSRDFVPTSADFREQINWNTTSDIVVLEVAGQRLFGYHAVDKRPLTDSELLDVKFSSLKDLGYEGTVPNAPERHSVLPVPGGK